MSINRTDLDWILLLVFLIGVYLLVNLVLPLIPNVSLATYFIQPVLWLLIAAFVVFALPNQSGFIKLRTKKSIIWLGLLLGFFQMSLIFISGLFTGFGKSPYSFTPLGITTNIFMVGSILLGMELSRAWLVSRLGKKHTVVAIVAISLLFTILYASLIRITGLSASLDTLLYINTTLLPLFAENLLATSLAFMAGPLASIAYLGIMLFFWWFIPVLPLLPWTFKGLIGTGIPILGLAMTYRYYISQTDPAFSRRKKEPFFGWIVTVIVAVTIIWFSLGIFPVFPTVVMSSSMEPAFSTGDVLIIGETSPDKINIGDIIQFRVDENMVVLHRVVEIRDDNGAKVFITKGDANDAPDMDPVLVENTMGKVLFTIPKLGWVAIGIKDFFAGE